MNTPATQPVSRYESLQTAASTYLTALEDTVPETTYWSHKQAVRSFVDWVDSVPPHTELESLIARFAGRLTGAPDYTDETVYGYLCSLVNLVSYIRYDEPEIVAMRVSEELSEETSVDVSGIFEPLQEQSSRNEDQLCSSEESISKLLVYLKQSAYGSRVHAYVETILGVKGRPSLVQKLDLENIDLDRGTVQIGISETYLVGSTNLVESREVDLPKRTYRTLKEYIRLNRTAADQENTEPLFTTHHGRASHSTLRRGIKQESRKISSAVQSSTESDTLTTSPVRPSDIWWYALSNAPE